MSLARIKETFFRLPNFIKLIGIGSIILAISTFLPWYADLDSYRIGDQFLGVTGPASFVGIVILLLSGFSLWIFSYHILERRVPRLFVREAIVHLFTAIESLFLLLIVNSIFFHPKFGVNITLKESRFGMTFALIGAIVLLIGGYMQNREQLKKEDDVGKLEPLIKMEPRPSRSEASINKCAEGATLPSYQRPHTIIKSAPVVRPTLIKPMSKMNDQRKGFLFGESSTPAMRTSSPLHTSPVKPQENPVSAPIVEDKDEGTGSFMHRMDL